MHNSLMDELRELIPPHISLNTWITEKLDISASSASRKITGTTPFNMSEISKILAVFPNLASCLIPTSERKTLLTGQFVDFNSRTEVANYLQTIKQTLELAISKGWSLHYFGRDLPIFHFFSSPLLFKYKVSVWCNDLGPESIEIIDDRLWAMAKDIYQLYLRMDTQEIWYRNLMKNQLYQLQYHYLLDKLSAEQVEMLLTTYRELVEKMKTWCTKGEKENGSFQLHITNYTLLNNGGVLLDGKKPLLLMTSLSSVFFLSTQHLVAIDHFCRDYDFHESQGLLISKSNELERFKFAKELNKQLSEFTF